MDSIDHLLFELIRISIGNQCRISRLPSDAEWEDMFDIAVKQSLVGVCYSGLRSLGADADDGFERIGINEDLYFNWMGMAAQINIRNEQVNDYTRKALDHFREHGFPCVVLKGQGVGALYKVKHFKNSNEISDGDLSSCRQSGDVDVWVNCDRKELYDLSMKEFGKIEGVTYHHIHYQLFEDCEVEAHIYPSFLHNLIRNNKLHRFFDLYKPETGCGDTPSSAFNRVYILLHIYNHFCGHGVGLRQLLDYYFVLCQGFSEEERKETVSWIRSFGMLRFTKAVMWVLKYVFGMDNRYLLTECNEKDGSFLLDEVMQTGNMGHWDKRVDHSRYRTAFGRYTQNFKRALKVAAICPDSALCVPFWGIYQFLKVKRIQLQYNK